MSYYIGNNPTDVNAGFIKRYFYGLRRNDDGELFVVRVDQLAGGDANSITINDLGIAEENFPDFEEGIDYLDGIDETKNIVYPNLRYPQLRWDGRSLTYYIESETGQFVQAVSEKVTYEENISSPAYGEGIDNQVLIPGQTGGPGLGFTFLPVTVGVDTVGGQASGVFYINGVERPELNITKGRTYVFDQSDSTNAAYATLNHPLMLSTVENGELAGGDHYNTGVIYKLDGSQVTMAQYVSGFVSATTRKVELTLGATAPNTLYYWCHFHTGQGNKINISEGSGY